MDIPVPIPYVFYFFPMIAALIYFIPSLRQRFMPHYSLETWYYPLSRLIISILIITLPFTFDPFVPEVSGDLRWYLLHSGMLFILMLFSLHVMLSAKNKIKLPLTLSTVSASFLALIVTLTLLWTASMIMSWWNLKHILSYILLFAFVVQLKDTFWYRQLLWLIVIGTGLNGLLGIMQFLDIHNHFMSYFTQAVPPAGSLANKNLAASYMVLTLPICIYLFFTSQKTSQQIIASCCFTLGAILLIYTRSRTSWISAILALLFFGIWALIHRQYLPHISINKTRLFLIVLSCASLISLSQLNTNLHGEHYSIKNSVQDQITSITHPDNNSVKIRLAYNLNGLKIIKDNPFGVGIGAFHTIYPKYHNAWVPTPKTGYNLSARPRRAHNDFLQMFVDAGVLGGFSMIFVFLAAITMSWRTVRNKNTPNEHRLLTTALMIGCVGICINAVGDFPLQMPTSPAILWVFVGMITALHLIHHQDVKYVICAQTHLSRITFFILSAIAFVGVTYDNTLRRTSAVYLKPALSLAHSGIYNDMTVLLIEEAYKTYPYSQRLQEIRGVALNAHGNQAPNNIKVTDRAIVRALEEHLKHDPYAQNTLVSLAYKHFEQARIAAHQGNTKEANTHLKKAEKYAHRATKLAAQHPHSETIYGLILLVMQQPQRALPLFESALKKAPDYTPALLGYQNTLLKLDKKTPGTAPIH